jgi:hypothetical protein
MSEPGSVIAPDKRACVYRFNSTCRQAGLPLIYPILPAVFMMFTMFTVV